MHDEIKEAAPKWTFRADTARDQAEVDRLQAELAKLAAARQDAERKLEQEQHSREKWNECALALEKKCGHLRDERDAAQRDAERLREALRWYGRSINWAYDRETVSNAQSDAGDKARAALQKRQSR